MKFRTPLIAAALLAAGIGSSAHAALEGRDLDGNLATSEAYYDTDRGITWLADANYAQTSGYDADGRMNWADANTWAANLSFTDGINVYDNWRLPTTPNPDATCSFQGDGYSLGFNCTGSEMGHLFSAELGGTAGQSILTSADPDLANFTNIQASSYWSATEDPFYPTDYAWLIEWHTGYQSTHNKSLVGFFAIAVSPGDVGIAAVPEPETWALLLAGLGLVGFAARRRGGAGMA